ncbi:MAG: hypothetical protein JWM41_2173 [Gemmatimonadetes bacterium]|nr:hypothetical protein [Gemmatimonadota bacterium]
MTANKSPAFQFYPDEFVGSGKVGTMTSEEVGVYVLLLCLEWNEVGFVFDEEELARWTRTTQPKFRAAWKRVSRCFVERDGKQYNPRLDAERAKQADWREKSRQGGVASAQARLNGGSKGGSTTVGTIDQPQGQPNVNTLSLSLTQLKATTLGTSDDAPAARSADGGSTKQQKHAYPDAFAATWAIYPPRAGNQPKHAAFKAWQARRTAGVTAEDMHAGVERYARFCASTGKLQTEFVMQAKTFFGPDERWSEPYDAPTVRAAATSSGKGQMMALAKRISALCDKYNLWRTGGANDDYFARLDTAATDPTAWPTFANDMKTIKLWDRIGTLPADKVEWEIVTRLEANAIQIGKMEAVA